MRVEEVILSNGKIRYMLVDKNGEPIQPVGVCVAMEQNHATSISGH
ncbi:hypothetical protein OCF15_28875 [Bacillus cereus]|nr:hypothetical protein [Bacillus cereus]